MPVWLSTLLAALRPGPPGLNIAAVVLAIALRQNVVESTVSTEVIWALFAVGDFGLLALIARAVTRWLLDGRRETVRLENQVAMLERLAEPDQHWLDEQFAVVDLQWSRVGEALRGVEILMAAVVVVGVPIGAIVTSPPV